MPKSKKRKTRKQSKTPIKKIKVIRCSDKELLEGAKAMLIRDQHHILKLVKRRKSFEKNSKEYKDISYEIKCLIDSHDSIADFWNLKKISE